MADYQHSGNGQGSEHKEWHDVPAGKYDVWVNAIRDGQTKSGKPRVSICYRVISGPERGNRVWDNVTMSEIGAEIIEKKLKAISPWPYEHNPKLTYGEEGETILKAIHDQRFRLDLSYNEKGFPRCYVTKA